MLLFLARFPKAKKMQNTQPPEEEIKFSNQQHLQIFPVKPVAKIPSVFEGKPAARKIIDFYRYNQVRDFTYDRPYPKGERDKLNEFASLWIERRLYRTSASFPGILRWFQVEETDVDDISPLQKAIGTAFLHIPLLRFLDTVTNKNNDLSAMLNEFHSEISDDYQSLSMQLQGTIDPAVAGGFANYERAFMNEKFLESCTSEERIQVENLKVLMSNQIPILNDLLLVFEEFVLRKPDMRGFHENLKKKFHGLKGKFYFLSFGRLIVD